MEKKNTTKISKRQAYADYLRHKYRGYRRGFWTPQNMSNSQVIKILGVREK